MRILYLQPSSSFGGAERQAAQSIGLLPRFGIEVVPVVGPGSEILAFLDDCGVHDFIFHADLPRDSKRPRGFVRRTGLIAEYVAALFRLRSAIAREVVSRRCDLIFASRPFAWVVAALVGAELNLPVVWRAGTNFEHWAQRPCLKFLSWRWPPNAVVYTSASVRRGIGPSVKAPSFVIHNGVDTERFRPSIGLPSLRGDLGLANEVPVVALVARIAPEKGTTLLVDVCRRLARMRSDLVVLVAGDSGWRPVLQRALDQAGLGKVVRLLGFVREVERVYAAADVVVSTSLDEGCPNGLLEAMAMGRAVVATRVGGTGEIISDGASGLLAPPGDAAALADRVAALLAAPRRRAELGRQAAEKVRADFSVERQVAQLAATLRWAASGESAAAQRELFARNNGARNGAPTQPVAKIVPSVTLRLRSLPESTVGEATGTIAQHPGVLFSQRK